jgi:hypothetical protein
MWRWNLQEENLPGANKVRLNDSFMLEERGTIDVKGKGEMHPWFLNSRNC